MKFNLRCSCSALQISCTDCSRWLFFLGLLGCSSSSSFLTKLLCIELLIELLIMRHTVAMRDLPGPAGSFAVRFNKKLTRSADDVVQPTACWSYVNLCHGDVGSFGTNHLTVLYCHHNCVYTVTHIHKVVNSIVVVYRLVLSLIYLWALQVVTGVVVYGRNTPGSRHLQSGQTSISCLWYFAAKTYPGLQQPLVTVINQACIYRSFICGLFACHSYC